MIWTYEAYGLGVRSELELPELAPADAGADVSVRAGRVTDGWSVDGLGRVTVRGDEITVDAADPWSARLLVLGRGLGAVLHRRGRLVLHGSAVEANGAAVAFVGAHGAGKSTTAAAIGRPLVADDMIPVEPSGVVRPGVRRVKLLPDAATTLGARGVPLHPLSGKISVAGGFTDGALPLERVYVVEPDDDTVVRPIAGHAACAALLRNAYGLLLGFVDDEADHLERCSAVAARTDVRRLGVRRGDLAHLVEVVERDLAA